MIAEPVLVYERGDTLDRALARVEAIAPDPEAGRAERDPVHPAIEPVADELARPTRILLTELLTAGLLRAELVDLADVEENELVDRRFVTGLRLRWRSRASPLARAARAAGVTEAVGVRRRLGRRRILVLLIGQRGARATGAWSRASRGRSA